VTGYILAINLVVAGLFAAVFAWLATHAPARPAARWLTVAYALGAASFVVEWLIPVFDWPRFVVFAAFATSLGGVALVPLGLARHYGQSMPYRLIGAVFLASLLLNLAIYDMPRASVLRVLLYQLPYVAVMAVAAWIVFSAQGRRRLDAILAWTLVGAALHFLSKPTLAWRFGTGARPQDYIDTIYGVISQTMGSMILVGFGLMMVAVLVHHVVADATSKSETDPLTGLLNRRGFEARARRVAPLAGRSSIPASIVICDLDRFKAINDTYGHAIGDKVIAAFAAQLDAALEHSHVAGRIGGEEFAVVLPGANAASARLFAETIRIAFASAPIDGLAAGVHPTASFGVAEMRDGDALSDMLRRADQALYRAKADGRDCVRVAPGPGALGDGDRRALRKG
jgi:diguanylate cyclase (GGDEF)-like protein